MPVIESIDEKNTGGCWLSTCRESFGRTSVRGRVGKGAEPRA